MNMFFKRIDVIGQVVSFSDVHMTPPIKCITLKLCDTEYVYNYVFLLFFRQFKIIIIDKKKFKPMVISFVTGITEFHANFGIHMPKKYLNIYHNKIPMSLFLMFLALQRRKTFINK